MSTDRRVLRALTVACAALVLTGCANLAAGASDGGAITPALSSVTPLESPKEWEGGSTARIDAGSITPITDGEQVLPATVIDSQDTSVTVTDTSRILALDLYGSLARTVFELGLGDQVVGRDISSAFEEIEDRPLVTQNGHDLNAEAILALDPTLIITDTSLGPWDTVLQMRDAGIPVVVVDSHRSIDTIGSLIGEVASALGVPQRGEVLSTRIAGAVEQTLAQVAAVTPADPADRLRMAFLYVRGQAGVYYLFGQESGADDLVTALGGVDVSAEIGWQGMRPLTDEGIVAAAPDLILMMSGGLESVDGIDGLLEAVPALQQTPAGQHRRVVDMSDTQILSFGPDTARVLDALAVAIYAPGDAG